MEKGILNRLGAHLRREIRPLEDLPVRMQAALRKLAEPHACVGLEAGTPHRPLSERRNDWQRAERPRPTARPKH